MSLEIEGNVHKILPEQTGEGRNGKWVKQDFVIETDDKYPKKICFSAWGDKADIVKTLNTGDTVKISFNVESREFKDRWYTDLRPWKIEKNPTASSSGAENIPKFTEDDIPPPEEEDLPF